MLPLLPFMSGAAGGLPPGALGLWNFMQPQVTASGSRYVANTQIAAAPSPNLLRASRRCFGTSQGKFWQVNNVLTVTDSNQTAWDGSNDASTITNPGGSTWSLTPQIISGFFPASGTYTMGIYVKWLGTGSANFKLGDSNGTPVLKTATASWVRYSTSISYGGGFPAPQPCIESPDGTSAANFAIIDFEMFAGAVDLGPVAINSHCYIGDYAFDANPLTGSNFLDCTGTGPSVVSFAVAQSLSAFTCVTLFSRAAAAQFAPNQHIVSDVNNENNFCPAVQTGNASNFRINNNLVAIQQNQLSADAFNMIGSGLKCTTLVYDGVNASHWNGANKLLFGAAGITTTANVFDLDVGDTQSGFSGLKIYALALWPRALSDNEVKQAYAYMKSLAVAGAVSIPTQRVVVTVGDSIAAGGYAGGDIGFFNHAAEAASPNYSAVTFGIGGTTALTMYSASLVAALLDTSQGINAWCVNTHVGTNDLVGGLTAAQALTNFDTYCATIKAAGFKIVANTIIDRTDGFVSGNQAAFNASRAAYNAGLRTRVGTTIDAVADFGDDLHAVAGNAALIGADGASTNATNFNANLHPTDAGCALMGPIIAAAIHTLSGF